jgi:hypothetical protein
MDYAAGVRRHCIRVYTVYLFAQGRGGALKVPKCEIFDRSDFNDFYTIKSLREGDCGVKI